MSSTATLLMDEDMCNVDDCAEVRNAFFSRDREMVTVCSSTGVSLFSTWDFSCKSHIRIPGGARVADLAHSSALFVIGTDSNSFQLWSATTCQPISPEVRLEEPILNVKVTAKRIVVLVAAKLLIFRLSNLDLIEAVDRGDGIPPVSLPLLECTEEGLCAFTIADNGVQVMDAVTLFRMQPIRSHTSPVSALELRNDILITGSSRGTILRVFRVPSMELVGLLRRGRSETAIRSIVAGSDVLAVTGDSDTVHFFRYSSSGIFEPSGTTIMGSVLSMFPKQYKDALEAQRDFAFVRLRREGSAFNYTAAVVKRGKSTDVVVVSEDSGFAFVYELNIAKGGECRLKSEHALLSSVGSFKPASCQPAAPVVRPKQITAPPTVLVEQRRASDSSAIALEVKFAQERPDDSPGETVTPPDFCFKTDEESSTPLADPVAVPVPAPEPDASEPPSGDADEWTEEAAQKEKKKKKKKTNESLSD